MTEMTALTFDELESIELPPIWTTVALSEETTSTDVVTDASQLSCVITRPASRLVMSGRNSAAEVSGTPIVSGQPVSCQMRKKNKIGKSKGG